MRTRHDAWRTGETSTRLCPRTTIVDNQPRSLMRSTASPFYRRYTVDAFPAPGAKRRRTTSWQYRDVELFVARTKALNARPSRASRRPCIDCHDLSTPRRYTARIEFAAARAGFSGSGVSRRLAQIASPLLTAAAARRSRQRTLRATLDGAMSCCGNRRRVAAAPGRLPTLDLHRRCRPPRHDANTWISMRSAVLDAAPICRKTWWAGQWRRARWHLLTRSVPSKIEGSLSSNAEATSPRAHALYFRDLSHRVPRRPDRRYRMTDWRVCPRDR